ncbi:hypothetical protein HOO68_06005 [Candidatus Gracilibacteria bacterium]|nr:hypothetical protein [Candidatus Gracilibacteria bacterium]
MKQSHITHALMIEATTKIEEQRSVIARLKEERREIVNVQQNTINMLQQRLKKIMERHFPIMKGPSVPWVVMIPHETMCQVNHHQSLQRIAERGGLSPGEAWCVVSGIDLSRRKTAIPWDEYEAEWEKFAERVNREYVLGDANVNTAADDPGSVQKDSNIGVHSRMHGLLWASANDSGRTNVDHTIAISGWEHALSICNNVWLQYLRTPAIVVSVVWHCRGAKASLSAWETTSAIVDGVSRWDDHAEVFAAPTWARSNGGPIMGASATTSIIINS